MTTATLLGLINAAPIIEVAPRRSVTLQVDAVLLGKGAITAEFELPDAEFEF